MLDLTQYDAVEVHPVAREVLPSGLECFEVCEPDHPALHGWSVYLHRRSGGVECMADCPSEEVAQLVAAGLERELQP